MTNNFMNQIIDAVENSMKHYIGCDETYVIPKEKKKEIKKYLKGKNAFYNISDIYDIIFSSTSVGYMKFDSNSGWVEFGVEDMKLDS